jgi:excisionase family DNA binding protein
MRKLKLCRKVNKPNYGAMIMKTDQDDGNKLPAAKSLLTVRQVAENWQISQRTVRRMIAKGLIKTVRLGRLVRIPV